MKPDLLVHQALSDRLLRSVPSLWPALVPNSFSRSESSLNPRKSSDSTTETETLQVHNICYEMFHNLFGVDHHDKRKYQPIRSNRCSISSKTREFICDEIEWKYSGTITRISRFVGFSIVISNFRIIL